jgi:hypothetical protein
VIADAHADQEDGHREGGLPIHENERGEELVPRIDERKQRHRHDRGDGEGQKYAREALPGRAAVNHRRLLDLTRDRLEAVAHEEDREGQLQDRMHDRQSEMGVDEPNLGEVEIEGRQQRLIGDHDGREQTEKRDLLAAHRKARQPVAGRRREHDAGRDRHQRNKSGIAHIGCEARLKIDDLGVVLEA